MSSSTHIYFFKFVVLCQYLLAILYFLINVHIIIKKYDCEYFTIVTIIFLNDFVCILEGVVGTLIVYSKKINNPVVIGSLVIKHLDRVFIRWHICISLASVLGSVGLAAASLNRVLNPCANDYTQVSIVCLFTSLSVGIPSNAVSVYLLYKLQKKLTKDRCRDETTTRDVEMDNDLYNINNNEDKMDDFPITISQSHDVAACSYSDDYESISGFLLKEQRNDFDIDIEEDNRINEIHGSTECYISPTPKLVKQISSISSKKYSGDESIDAPLTKDKHGNCDIEVDNALYIKYKDDDSSNAPNGCLPSISQKLMSSSSFLPNERKNEESIGASPIKEQRNNRGCDVEIDNNVHATYNPQISNASASNNFSNTEYDKQSISGCMNKECGCNCENSHKKCIKIDKLGLFLKSSGIACDVYFSEEINV